MNRAGLLQTVCEKSHYHHIIMCQMDPLPNMKVDEEPLLILKVMKPRYLTRIELVILDYLRSFFFYDIHIYPIASQKKK